MFKVCLTATNTMFSVDAFVRQKHLIVQNIWQIKISRQLNSLNNFSLLAIQLFGFLAKPRTRKCQCVAFGWLRFCRGLHSVAFSLEMHSQHFFFFFLQSVIVSE